LQNTQEQTSCGCLSYKIKNLLNKRFGKLVVTSQLHDRHRYRYVMWECLCDCGSVTKVTSSQLLNANVKSCGCLMHKKNSDNPRWKGFKEISGKKWGDIIRSAKKRNIIFDITIQEAWDVFIRQNRRCALSGLPLELDHGNKAASLDRIDNSKGYIASNIQWLHKDVNCMKMCHSQDHFRFLCNLIASHKLD
jgi:hypothetical protein